MPSCDNLCECVCSPHFHQPPLPRRRRRAGGSTGETRDPVTRVFRARHGPVIAGPSPCVSPTQTLCQTGGWVPSVQNRDIKQENPYGTGITKYISNKPIIMNQL